MPLPFNKNLDLKLIKLVKDNPTLYNPKHSKYLDFDSREVVWQKIGDSLGRPAADFAGIQCQIHFGDYQEKKPKPGFIENLQEYLPVQYSNAWGIEKKILKAYSQHTGLTHLDAKYLYIKTARALPTYGVTFFLVKEKQKDKKKLVPRLLGINSESILRLDEVTKEILQQWPLTHVKTYHAGKSQTFTLNFGDYSDKEYSVKTQDAYRIRDILEGYIDIIRRRMLAKPHADPGDAMVICDDNIQMGKSHLIQHVSNNASKIVTQTFVGPTKILPFDQGSKAQQGTQIMTVQQIVVTDLLQNQQHVLKGEIPLQGDMSKDCVRKLNRMNSNSVKIVTLLTDPKEGNVTEAQTVLRNMQEDFPAVQTGVKETAAKQSIEESKKMLMDELEDLNNYMNKLAGSLEPGRVNASNAKDAAEGIADLTTQMYFSIDPKTRRRSELLRRSRKSFKAGEKTEETIRRASFIAAATAGLHSVDNAGLALNEEYKGPKLDDHQRKRLEQALEDKMGKLNAATALYLTAHSDPNNIDYSAAINSMNAITELMPKLSRDAQMLGSTKDDAGRKELRDEMRTLFDATKKVCSMTGTGDHEKMQDATNAYADIAGKLIFTFARGTNADKENEIIDLAKDAGDKTSLLLVTANELTCQATKEPAAADVDEAGVRTAGAARDLLATAQLTAPAIREPHCQSALTAAASGLASSVHQMEAAWRPLTEDPTRHHMSEQLHGRAMDVMHALERLRDAYGNLDGMDIDDADAALPLQERQRLKFINTMAGARNNLQGVEGLWNKSASDTPSEEDKVQAQLRLKQKMAQLNAAVAALAAATADRENPDYETADQAIRIISQLMPQIVKDTEVVSSDNDESTRNAMLKNIQALCEASRQMCDGAGYQHGQGEAASNFAAASGKLVFLISPDADKGKERHIMDQSSSACGDAADLVGQVRQLMEQLEPATAVELDNKCHRVADATHALYTVAQVTAPSIGEARCQNQLTSAAEKLRHIADDLVSSCHPHLQQRPEQQQQVLGAQQKLNDSLNRLIHACQLGDGSSNEVASPHQEKQRLKFVSSISGAKGHLDAASQLLNQPMLCQMMRQEDAEELERKLANNLARLNAAIAALAAATADRGNPDYAAADRAVNTITQLMPQVVQDSRKLCGTKTDAEQAAMLQDLRALCEATQEICDNAGQPQGLGDAAGKFSAASGKLMFLMRPGDNARENQVIDLTSAACGKTSELLAQVQRLAEQLAPAGGAAPGGGTAPGGGAAAALDRRGAAVADAAQALLTVAQVTAPSIASPQCQQALVSAAERLRAAAGDLAATSRPHVELRPQEHQQMMNTHRQLEDSLNKLIHACKAGHHDSGSGLPSAQQEKQRLKFVSSVSGAKNRLYDAEQQLKQPMLCQLMREEDAAALQHKLSQRLAQLNAAVAALATATADRENPDYTAADRAVKAISELMPQVVQDSRKLCGTKDDAGQMAMLQDLRELCEATREICENAGQSQGLGDAAAKFSTASSRMLSTVSPGIHDPRQQQVVDLSTTVCGKASELLSQVQQLTGQVDPAAVAELDARGSRTADAAQGLLTVAQVAGSSLSEPSCSAALALAATRLQNSAQELTTSCRPHLQQRPEVMQQVQQTQHQMDDSIKKLLNACKAVQDGTSGIAASPHEEEQRRRFIRSMAGAKGHLGAAEQLLKEPMVCQLMKPEDGAKLQQTLSQRLAKLNAAIAALAAATADRENPDYAAADRAVRTINELMPQVVQDSRVLCGTKDEAGQAAMLHDLKSLCDATRDICDNAGKPEGLSDAAAKFSAASGKLVFLISPKAQDAQEKQVMSLSAAACGKTSELLGQVQHLREQLQDPAAAGELDSRGARTADAAQALLTVAQLTSPSISEPHCSKELVSAADKLRVSAGDLTVSCGPHLQQRSEMQQQVLSTHRQLDDSLDKLVKACKAGQAGNLVEGSSPHQEKERLKFISSMSGAKNHLDAAEQQLKKPMMCQPMKPEDGAKLQQTLSQRLAKLNAAIAALAAATADRENPDYAAADRAVKTITELMPQVVQDSRVLCGTKDEAGQAAMLHDLKSLCDATREICDNAGKPEGLSDAAAKFSAASGKLVFVVSPKANDVQEKRVMSLSAAACGKTSELLAQVQHLREQLQDPAAAGELDARGARTADAAQALLTVAQLTSPSISEPHCSKELVSAAEKLRVSAEDLTVSCGPHLQQRPEMQQQVLSTHRQLDDSLDKLLNACNAGHAGNLVEGSSPHQEKHRLKFISSMSGAKNRLDAAEQQLKEPMVCQLMKPEDGAKLQQTLSQRLAKLNAAIAALAAATADRENPDYAAADQAVSTITELMPQVVQDSLVLCGTKDEAGQAAMLQDLKSLCDATREICDNAGKPEGLSDAAAKFSAASGKLVFLISPKANDAREKQVMSLSAATCGKTSELLAQVQHLREQLQDPAAAGELDARGARTADAAQALLTVAQLTSPSISEPHCSKELVSAAEKLRVSAGDLTVSCGPHLQQRPEMQQQVLSTHRQLDDSLNKLVHACRAVQAGNLADASSVNQEKQRLKFVSSMSGAKNHLDAAEKQLREPMVCQLMKPEDGAKLQQTLSQRLAKLNAAIAALAAATADRENPDYVAADRAVKTITELMPQVVQDSRVLCGTKDEAGQAAMLHDLKSLCDATREICDNAGQPEGLSDAAAKFSAASEKLVFLVSPKAQDAQGKQVMSLSAAACGKTSELLAQVQHLREQLQDPAAAGELDARGARTADVAQALLTVAQLTSPSISEPHCSKELVSAADKLRVSAGDLTVSCGPHLQQRPEMQQQVLSTHRQLDDSLDKLVNACKAGHAGHLVDASSAQQEKLRHILVSSVSGAKQLLDASEKHLNERLEVQKMKPEDGAALQFKLSQRLAQLNAAIAALTAATSDRENPDYAAADQAVKAISVLMPQIVQDSRTLCSTKDPAGQAAMLQDLRALCEASRGICDSATQPGSLNEAAAKFSAASAELVNVVKPKADDAQEKRVINQSAIACGKASELLAQVQHLTGKVDSATAAELDARGAKTADAAEALLTIAQLTAPSISEPACSSTLLSTAEKLRTTAAELSGVCTPHLKQHPELQKQMQSSRQQLEDSLDKLVATCKDARHDVTLSPQQEQQRLKFVNNVAGAINHLDAAEKKFMEPIVCPLMKPGDSSALEHQLSRRLGQLNAAVAALSSATSDGKNPDYPAAERAVITITELMPHVIQDSRTLCCTKDEAGQTELLHSLKALCDASRVICNSAGQPKKLYEGSAKLGNASAKLLFTVRPDQSQQQTGVDSTTAKRKPPVPLRNTKSTIAHAVPSRKSESAQDFLDALRGEEENENKVRIVAMDTKRVYEQFSEVVETGEKDLTTAENVLKVLYNANTITVPGLGVCAVEVANREQHMEDTLAKAGVEVATLVAANYADKLDYESAIKPTRSLTNCVRSVVDDGSVISSSIPENDRKPFIDDMIGLCEATKNIYQAARTHKEKLNDAAITFGDKSGKLLRVVSCDINPALEKEVISRAKAIGDTASRLALEASNVAASSTPGSPRTPPTPPAPGEGASHVQNICTAGARCVDAAGKLVYTAKLIAPTIHHTICQEALISSADSLSSFLTTFSKTWQPLTSTQNPNVQKLTQEAKNLEDLVEKMRKDIRDGKLGKRRDVDKLVMVDSPLSQMTLQIIETANALSEHGEMDAVQKKEYSEYSSRLADALRALDLANARCQRAPHDKNKREEMEIAVQDLQVMLLQTRPSRAGQEQNNIVDFRDFLQSLVNEADQLKKVAKTNEGPAGKRTTDDIKLLCSKISEDANKLSNPTDQHRDGMTVMTSVADVMDIDQFGQECDILVKEINASIQGIHDQKAKQALRAKALPLTESCNLLRFATNSHISATKSAAFDEAVKDLDNFESAIIKPLVNDILQKNKKGKKAHGASPGLSRAAAGLLAASRRAASGDPQPLGRALTYYAAAAAQHTEPEELDPFLAHLKVLVEKVQAVTSSSSLKLANWDPHYTSGFRSQTMLKDLDNLNYKVKAKPGIQVLNEEDIDKLLACERIKIEGTPKQLQDLVQQLATKLSSISGTIVLSVKKPESLTRSLHLATDVAAQLANAARSLKDHKKPVQAQKIEDAAHEMCLATYSLMKTSELVCQDPKHHDSRRKLLEACHHLNDSINKLVRRAHPSSRVSQECDAVSRLLQLQRSGLQAAPGGALPYGHCVETLQEQRDLIQKLNSDQSMSREEFLKNMIFITSAVSNSTECAAQATYLLSVSEKDESIGKEGIVDVAKLHKTVDAVQDTCVSIIMAQQEEQIQDERKTLESEVEELVATLDDGIKKTKNTELKKKLKQCKEDIEVSYKAFCNVVNQKKPKEVIMSTVMSLMVDVSSTASLIEHPDLVPTVGEVSAETQAKCDEIVKSSLALLTNTEYLMKQVKAAPEETEVMTWVMFSKRKDVLDAFNALLKSVKSHGQKSKLLEGSEEDSEEQKKSYVQRQFDAASKWLLKPMAKAEVKSNGQQAVRNLIEVATKVTEDLKGPEKEDMRHLVLETEQLLTECCKKYDHEQYSVLMERVRDLKKGIERGVVTRVVEDFMEAEAPLADLDIVADYEKDETKRKFLLEKKIAELLAHLSRVTKTARLIADTDKDTGANVSKQLNTCSQQAELLAPMLVKAAQERVAKPDDKAAIENYMAMLAKYAESLSKIRDLCDQSVDPMEFVQTAGETMQRMREESTQHNDPQQCAHTSAAITKLANRVINVGMSSHSARRDPELQQALGAAGLQLAAATPAPDTRASRMPDWKDTTARILQATEEVESLLGGETIFKKQPEPNQPIYNEALNLHVAIRDWSSRDNEIVAVAKRMAVLMAKLSNFMNNDKQHEVLATSKSIVMESNEVARLAKKLAHECTDHRIKTNLLQTCERIPTISGQLKMLTTVKGFSLGRHGTQEDKEAMDMLVGNAQSLMLSIQDVVKVAASASVKIMSQRGLRMKWVRRPVY